METGSLALGIGLGVILGLALGFSIAVMTKRPDTLQQEPGMIYNYDSNNKLVSVLPAKKVM